MVKHTQTIRRLLPTNCLSVFDHFVGLVLKGLKKNKVNLVYCAVTVDGTWQTQYGHDSKLGVTLVLSVDTDEVLTKL